MGNNVNLHNLREQGLAQGVIYIESLSNNVLKVSMSECAKDLTKALTREAEGGATQFMPKVSKIEGVGSYIPTLPSQSLYVEPTTISNSHIERSSYSYDNVLNKNQLEMSNENTVNSYLITLSNNIYQNKEQLINELGEIRRLDVYSLENSLSSQEDLHHAIKRVDDIINVIHKDDALPAFMAHGYNALYFAMIMNLLSLERLVYAINWLHLNSANITEQLYSSLYHHYENLRQEVVEADIDQNGVYILSDNVRFRLVSIAHFFERIIHIQKNNVFNTIYSQESEESLRNIMLKIQSDSNNR